jgi:hypothetical protein
VRSSGTVTGRTRRWAVPSVLRTPRRIRRTGCAVVGRYYDPGTVQFLSVDPKVHETQQPYIYANDDPTGATDPLGMSYLTLRCNGVESWASPFATSHGIIAALSYDCKLWKVFWVVTFTRPTWDGYPIAGDIYELGLRYERLGGPVEEESGHVEPWGYGFHGRISNAHINQRYAISDTFNFWISGGEDSMVG